MLAVEKYLLDSVYDISDFNADQIKEMELGLKQNGSISYCNPAISVSAEEMRKIRGPIKIKI